LQKHSRRETERMGRKTYVGERCAGGIEEQNVTVGKGTLYQTKKKTPEGRERKNKVEDKNRVSTTDWRWTGKKPNKRQNRGQRAGLWA